MEIYKKMLCEIARVKQGEKRMVRIAVRQTFCVSGAGRVSGRPEG